MKDAKFETLYMLHIKFNDALLSSATLYKAAMYTPNDTKNCTQIYTCMDTHRDTHIHTHAYIQMQALSAHVW